MTKEKYSGELLESIAADLRKLPPIDKKKQEHSKQESVRILSKEIFALQKRGYSLEQIAAILCEKGIQITTATLKSCLQRLKSDKKTDKGADTSTSKKAAKASDAPTSKKAETAEFNTKTAFKPRPDTEEI